MIKDEVVILVSLHEYYVYHDPTYLDVIFICKEPQQLIRVIKYQCNISIDIGNNPFHDVNDTIGC